MAARTEAFAAEFQAVGVAGQFLAHRAAVLSVRMNQAELDAKTALRAHVQAAHAAFDAARVTDLDRLVDLLTRRLAMHGARVELEQMPDGIDRLLDFWDRQRELIQTYPDHAETRHRVGSLLNLTAEQIQGVSPAELVERIATEQTRLRQVDDVTRAGRLAALDRERDAVGQAARLDPPRQVIQICRYDAAAERGFYRAIRAIQDLRRAHDRTNPTEVAAAEPASKQGVVVPAANETPVAPPAPALTATAGLGSFRPSSKAGRPLNFTAAVSLSEPDAGTKLNRLARREERKRAKKRR